MNTVPVAPAATEYLYRKASAAGIPLSGTFELTPVCNMDCKMCYVRMSRSAQEAIAPLKGASQWLALAQEAKDAGMLYLLITGGEPFLHPQFQEILEGLHKMGFLITINSNGTMIDESVIAWLKNCPPVRINISLYGASNETYANLCGNPMGFTQTVNAIRLLQQAGISVKLNCSLTPYNAKNLPEMAAFSKQNNLILQVATYMFPPVRKDGRLTGTNDRFSPEDAAYYMAYADYLTLGKERFLAQEGQLPEILEPEGNCDGDGVRCRAGKCSFWISWQGKMMPCGMFPEKNAPNVFEMPFLNAWQATKESIGNIHLPARCSACNVKDICRACAAMVVTESGCFDKVPKYRCDMMRAYKAQWKRVKEEML
jgi:radical SAM protein with 4Fe4S-binding SPASM domain